MTIKYDTSKLNEAIKIIKTCSSFEEAENKLKKIKFVKDKDLNNRLIKKLFSLYGDKLGGLYKLEKEENCVKIDKLRQKNLKRL